MSQPDAAPLGLTAWMYHYVRDPGDVAEASSGIPGLLVARFAEHFAARMFLDGVIACHRPWPFGRPGGEDETRQGVAQAPERPASVGEDALITGRMPADQKGRHPQPIAHRAPARGHNGSHAQEQPPLKGGVSKGRRKGQQ